MRKSEIRASSNRLKLSYTLSVLLSVCFHVACFGQQKPDTVQHKSLINRMKEKRLTKEIIKSISHTPPSDETINAKSEDPFLRYDGKIIRKILVNRIGFDKTILDTARNIKNFVTRTANALHNDTKEMIVRQNLFIREGKPINPYRLADNERFLRGLDFMLDARIYVKPIKGQRDSVDVLVVTRDVFSLGGAFSPDFPKSYKFNVQDVNLGGFGQRLQFGGLYDIERRPRFGYEWIYKKTNVFGSFIDATLGYTKINTGTSLGAENETSAYVRLFRPLFNPFTRWAGGMELGKNISRNVYHRADSIFAGYHYDVMDYWAGYSFGYKKQPRELKENRNRKFIAIRRYQQHFLDTPSVKLNEQNRFIYQDRTALLAQVTFFKQNFYKTQYVVGFGRTEDIPYGYRISFTTGYEKEQRRRRPYMGAETYFSVINKNGTFFTYTAKLASFWHNGVEDGLFSFNFTRFSKVYEYKSLKIRHQFSTGYAQEFNRFIKRQIDINDLNGVVGFRSDSLAGNERITLSNEAVVFTKKKFLGFKLAPLARADFALLAPRHKQFWNGSLYSGFSLGLRARNENLIFNTIEARVFYYPRTVEGRDHLSINVTANLRIKYPTNLINPPNTVYDQ